MRAAFFACQLGLGVLLAASGCAALSGLSGLEEVDCVGAQCGDATADSSTTDVRGRGDTAPDTQSEAIDTGVDSAADSDTALEGGADADSAIDTDAALADSCVLGTLDNCGACGAKCDTITSKGAVCLGGTTCSYAGCVSGFTDCDRTAPNTNGCESSLTSPTSCTACGVSCDTTRSIGANCTGTQCTYAGCVPGFGDCDGDATGLNANGCETALNSPTNCTACGANCDTLHSTGAACTGTTCTYAGCASGYADCNSAPPNLAGCATKTTTTTDCGGCARACSTLGVATASCSTTGTCNSTCTAGLHNCSQPAAPALDDGCECAGTACCGTACQPAHSNGTSAAGLGQTYFDCSPLGTPGVESTYTKKMADEALAASPYKTTPGAGTCGSGATLSNCVSASLTSTATDCAVWCYSGALAGSFHVDKAGCFCPLPPPPPTSDTWN